MMKQGIVKRLIFYPLIIIVLAVIFKAQIQAVFSNNGFDLSDTLIDAKQIYHGGPVKDGIPAIDKPVFIKAEQADFLAPTDRVLALSINGIDKAYPVSILNYHEIVNDYFATQAVVVTYCPLCGSGTAYNARIDGENTTFGVSGLLYNSDVLLYDRKTNSLWSQILSQAISGALKGNKLEMLPVTHTSWQDWKTRYPGTLVLSTATGYQRDYQKSPYQGYELSEDIYFPVNKVSQQFHPKEYVIGLEIDGKYKVYPFAELSQQVTSFKDEFAGHKLTVVFDAINRTGYIINEDKQRLNTIMAFWFAWMAFHPESEVFISNTH